MKLILLIFFMLLSSTCFACQLKKADFISLSGPLTFLIKKLELQNDSNFKAKLAVHKIGKTSAKDLAGGLFISKKELKKYKKPVIIYDESKQLEKTIKDLDVKNKYEIKTLGLTPFEVYENSIEALKQISSKCEKKIISLNEKVTAIKIRLLKHASNKGPLKPDEKRIDYTVNTSLRPAFEPKTVIFFLGDVKEKKFPTMVMVNDHFVKFLLDNKLIKTYPTDLAYLPWSAKILKSLVSPIYIGIVEDDNMREGRVKIKKSENNIINVFGNGILTPGISQVFLLPSIFQAIY